jgi:uncharacterized membrane protein YeaQ/YmgE (transglycosylase-associated protein family)
MEILWILLFGLIVGAVAKAIMPGDDPGGIVATALIGVVGSVIGFYLFRAIGIGDANKFDIGGFIGAVVGTLLLLGLYRMIAGRRSHGHSGGTHRPTSVR